MPEIIGIEVIPPMLTTLRKNHPNLTVELHMSNKPAHVLAQKVDMPVRTFAPGFQTSIGNLAQRGGPASIADLTDHDTLVPTSRLPIRNSAAQPSRNHTPPAKPCAPTAIRRGLPTTICVLCRRSGRCSIIWFPAFWRSPERIDLRQGMKQGQRRS